MKKITDRMKVPDAIADYFKENPAVTEARTWAQCSTGLKRMFETREKLFAIRHNLVTHIVENDRQYASACALLEKQVQMREQLTRTLEANLALEMKLLKDRNEQVRLVVERCKAGAEGEWARLNTDRKGVPE